jgi:hypothetical protein
MPSLVQGSLQGEATRTLYLSEDTACDPRHIVAKIHGVQSEDGRAQSKSRCKRRRISSTTSLIRTTVIGAARRAPNT